MITLQINDFDLLNLESELNLKIDGIKALDSTTVLTELANAVFTLSGKAFIKALNLEAKAKPKAYHHIYEWGKIGTEAGRLFFLYRQSNAEGVLSIKPGFVQSRTPVPISSELMMPGKTGKSVAAKTIFKNKANVMETGKPVVYRASKNLPIPSGGTLKFVAAGTLIQNSNPGGKEVKGSFEKFFKVWYSTKVQSVVSSSGIMNAIDKETALILNNKGFGPQEVQKAIVNLLKQYAKNEAVI